MHVNWELLIVYLPMTLCLHNTTARTGSSTTLQAWVQNRLSIDDDFFETRGSHALVTKPAEVVCSFICKIFTGIKNHSKTKCKPLPRDCGCCQNNILEQLGGGNTVSYKLQVRLKLQSSSQPSSYSLHREHLWGWPLVMEWCNQERQQRLNCPISLLGRRMWVPFKNKINFFK